MGSTICSGSRHEPRARAAASALRRPPCPRIPGPGAHPRRTLGRSARTVSDPMRDDRPSIGPAVVPPSSRARLFRSQADHAPGDLTARFRRSADGHARSGCPARRSDAAEAAGVHRDCGADAGGRDRCQRHHLQLGQRGPVEPAAGSLAARRAGPADADFSRRAADELLVSRLQRYPRPGADARRRCGPRRSACRHRDRSRSGTGVGRARDRQLLRRARRSRLPRADAAALG